jgi:hypothetical protein
MKLTTVLSCVNDNPKYYKFIPYQIHFWNKFKIRFIVFFVGEKLPEELIPYKNFVILWDKTPELNSVFVSQNLRLYAPTMLSLPDDEMVMITDMDMLPMTHQLYTEGLEQFEKDDFIYYTDQILHDSQEIFMAYNAAHPTTWAKVFNIHNTPDIINRLHSTYLTEDKYLPGSNGWFIDQHNLYHYALSYPKLKHLKRCPRRLEIWDYERFLHGKIFPKKQFIQHFDDAHFHRDFQSNIEYIEDARRQIDILYP